MTEKCINKRILNRCRGTGSSSGADRGLWGSSPPSRPYWVAQIRRTATVADYIVQYDTGVVAGERTLRRRGFSFETRFCRQMPVAMFRCQCGSDFPETTRAGKCHSDGMGANRKGHRLASVRGKSSDHEAFDLAALLNASDLTPKTRRIVFDVTVDSAIEGSTPPVAVSARQPSTKPGDCAHLRL